MNTTNVNGSKKNWWLLAGLVVLLLAGAWWAFGPFGKVQKAVQQKKTGTEVVSTTDEGNTNSSDGLSAKDCEIRDLKKDLADREGKLAQANSTIAMLAECCSKKSPATYKPATPPAPKNTGGSSAGNTGGASEVKNVPAQSESEYVVGGTIMPKTKLRIEKGEVKSCWQFGPNVWYPYIAVQQNNEQFPNSADNGVGGLDLWFTPSGTVGSTSASCGIAEDGTHWFRVSEARKYEAWITFETPRPIINGVFKPSTLAVVNGEQFFVAK